MVTRLRPRLPVFVSLLAALLLAACTTATPGVGSRAEHVEQRGPAGAVPAGLERFYGQQLDWSGCQGFATTPDDEQAYSDPALQCSYLTVPLDYARPDGRTMKIGVLRRVASDPAARIGSLIVNPGGPGASGMSTAASLVSAVKGTALGARFDLVGFDPRGIGSSEPQVHCFTGPERDADRMLLTVDTSPAGVARTESEERDYVAKCVARTGVDVLAAVGTDEVARDLDVLRSVLGDAKLTYVGFSYGTRLGTTYAEDFPGNVRAMVLDGAVDPAQQPADELVDQGKGFQEAFNAFAAWCTARPGCALGTDATTAVAAFRALVNPLIDKGPVPDRDGRMLSYSDATTGVIQALYTPSLWDPLNRGLTQLATGRGDILKLLADVYYGRSPDGSYSTITDAFNAIRCDDDPHITDPAVDRSIDARYRAVAPFLDDGHGPSPARDICAFWPVPATSTPHVPKVPGLPAVLVVSTTGDPATPYQAGVDLAKDLGGELLTVEGTQHTAFLQGNSCVDDEGTAYLVNLTLPADGARCADG